MEIIFTSERLLFRQFSLEDADLIYALNSDPGVTQFVHEPETTRDVAKDVVANIIIPQYKQNNFGRWAVHLKTNREFIGWCGLKRILPDIYPDLGYRFFKNYWGNGYATEAAKRTIEYGFVVMALPGISATAHVDNISSCKVSEKCGMQYKGTEQLHDFFIRTYELLNNVS